MASGKCPSEYVMGPMIGRITLLNRPNKIAESSRPIAKSTHTKDDKNYQEKLKFVKNHISKISSDKKVQHKSIDMLSLKKVIKSKKASDNKPEGKSEGKSVNILSKIDVNALNLETENILSMQRLMVIKSTQSSFGTRGAHIANTLRSSFIKDSALFFHTVTELQKYCNEFTAPILQKNVAITTKNNIDILISSPDVHNLETGLSTMPDILEIFLNEPDESIQTYKLWYYSQFRHLLWCANAAALSMGPRLLQSEIIDKGNRGFRLQTLQFATDLAAHCDVAIANYMTSNRNARMEMLINIEVSALAIHEAACLIATEDVFSKLSQIATTSESSTANSLVTVVPMLVPNIQTGIRFISEEIAAIKQLWIEDAQALALAGPGLALAGPGRGDGRGD